MKKNQHCQSCEQEVDWKINQSIGPRGELMWSRSMTCGSCGATIEEDSTGIPPTWVRENVLEQQGVWNIRLLRDADRQKAVLKLRALLGLDLKAAGNLLKDSDSMIWSGTHVECAWLAYHLKELGIEVSIESAKQTA